MTLTSVSGIRVGHAQVEGGGSGCTVLLGPFRGAAEVRGMATGTRELEVLTPYHLVEEVHGLLLTGGSVFGLAAADGVVRWLADGGQGFDTGVAPVPLVPAAVIFDLASDVPRPGPDEGRRAAQAASYEPVEEGAVGAGAGATVGKLLGPNKAMKGGVGSASQPWGGGTVGALAVVNALGDVVGEDGEVLAGAAADGDSYPGSDSLALELNSESGAIPGANTTLVVIATDIPLTRVDLGKLTKMAASALPRAITPVHTPFDGDIVFALSTGKGPSSLESNRLLGLGVVARKLTETAIRRAVLVRSEVGKSRGKRPGQASGQSP